MFDYVFKYGEGNSAIAFVVLMVFAFSLGAIDMLVMLVTAFRMWMEDAFIKMEDPVNKRLIRISKCLKHVEMLDVLIMGVLVVVLCGASYSSKGVLFETRVGLWFLLIAEVLHYLCFYTVLPSIEFAEECKEDISQLIKCFEVLVKCLLCNACLW